MGAWDYGVFDDDAAYDALYDLMESEDIIDDMEEYFDNIMQEEYINLDDGYYALISAAVIDSVINDAHYECDNEDYCEWIQSLKNLDLTPLKQKAVNALDKILSDNSELKELWEENEKLYTLWKEDKLAIQKRLL